MTTFRIVTRVCCVCGRFGRYQVLTSTNTLGPYDLDTRPSEMARSTISGWIQRCPGCGYCAPDVAEGPAQARRIVTSDPYRQQRDAPEYPPLANRFLCWAMIQAAGEDYSRAGWAAIHAAWACDDAQADEAATACRQRAIEFLSSARAQGITFHEEPGTEEAVLADLLRRSGQFGQVPDICRIGLAKRPGDVVRQVLRFQRTLAAAQDRRCHTVAEV